jgi:hypothetical protein
MEQVRNVRLDNFCEALSEIRASQASLRADEQGNMQGALVEMHRTKMNTYRHAGVELLRVEGEEKLRVRVRAAEATTDGAGAEEGDAE